MSDRGFARPREVPVPGHFAGAARPGGGRQRPGRRRSGADDRDRFPALFLRAGRDRSHEAGPEAAGHGADLWHRVTGPRN
ncbi:hypothetical protein [Actinoplanes sp. NPDC048796]|uniref:hypothetical protein n=1 Tax=Actinoplanes sp. NPDC048796 TaxID=3155640 RepID=UPI0033F3C38C